MQTKRLSNLNFYSPVFSSNSSMRKKYVYIQKDSKIFFDLSLVKEIQSNRKNPSTFASFLTYLRHPFKLFSSKKQSKKDLHLVDAYSLFYQLKKEHEFSVEPFMSIFIPTIPHLKIPTFSYPLIKEGKKGHQETLTANIKLSFSLKGQLFHDTSGLVYLKVDRALAQSLIKQIDAEIESSFDDLYPFHGAHIAVIAPTLSRQYHLLGSVKETGERYFFGINKIIKETLYNHPEIDTIWYVAIESNSLDQLQRKYLGYTSPLYLILGVKKKELAHQAFQDTYFRTNDAFNFV